MSVGDPIEQWLLDTFRHISTDRAKRSAVALIENCVRLQEGGVRATADLAESVMQAARPEDLQERDGHPEVMAEAVYLHDRAGLPYPPNLHREVFPTAQNRRLAHS